MDLLIGVAVVAILFFLAVKILSDYDLDPLIKKFRLPRISIVFESESVKKTEKVPQKEITATAEAQVAVAVINNNLTKQNTISFPLDEDQPVGMETIQDSHQEPSQVHVSSVAVSNLPSQAEEEVIDEEEVDEYKSTLAELPEVLDSVPDEYEVDESEEIRFDSELELYPVEGDFSMEKYTEKLKGVEVGVRKIANVFKRSQRNLEKDSDQLAQLLTLLWKKEELAAYDVNAEQIYNEAFSDENHNKFFEMYNRVMAEFEEVESGVGEFEQETV